MSVQEVYVERTGRKRPAEKMYADLGKRLKALRIRAGVSQEGLADAMGVTFQQIQKYESGQNRLHIAKLHQICDILDIGWSYFLDPVSDSDRETLEAFHSLVLDRTAMDLLEAFNRIPDGATRKALVTMAQRLADK
jgi:transcriptional regulator with XRE-family HTH domain